MSGFLGSLNGLEIVFFVCAIMGGILFASRLILQFVGGQHDGDTSGVDHVDTVDGDMSVDHPDAHHELGDSDASFRLLSLQGLTGFFLMFGLVGLTVMRETEFGAYVAIIAAAIAGYATLYLIAWLTSIMLSLQSSGTLDLGAAVGQQGTVYLRIPADGTGKASVTIQDHLRVMDAVSEEKEELKTGERVTVTQVVNGNVLVVKKA